MQGKSPGGPCCDSMLFACLSVFTPHLCLCMYFHLRCEYILQIMRPCHIKLCGVQVSNPITQLAVLSSTATSSLNSQLQHLQQLQQMQQHHQQQQHQQQQHHHQQTHSHGPNQLPSQHHMTPPSQQQTSVPSPGSACSSASGQPQQSPPHRHSQSPARSLPSPVTPPMPLPVSPTSSHRVCVCAAEEDVKLPSGAYKKTKCMLMRQKNRGVSISVNESFGANHANTGVSVWRARPSDKRLAQVNTYWDCRGKYGGTAADGFPFCLKSTKPVVWQ